MPYPIASIQAAVGSRAARPGGTLTFEQTVQQIFGGAWYAYWPMTEASGNALDHGTTGFPVTWAATGVTRQGYTLPNGDKIVTLAGGDGNVGEGKLYSDALRDIFPYNHGCIICVVNVPLATWEDAASPSPSYLYNFSNTKFNYASRSKLGGTYGYRNSGGAFDNGGYSGPCMLGKTWDSTSGVMALFTNGERRLGNIAGQETYADLINTNYTRIGSSTSFGTNKWIGAVGHFILAATVPTDAQMKLLYQAIFPSTRKFFIVGDSKSTGANFWPGYLQNLLETATGDLWTDGPRRYALGGYDISALKNYINANLAAETETPEFILLNAGTNDARAVTITAEAIFKADYCAVIDACRAKWPGVPIFCQRVYRCDSATTIANSTTINSYIDWCIAQYGSGVYAGPDDAVWAENGDVGATYISTDKVHYSIAAHSVLAGLWAAILTPYVT